MGKDTHALSRPAERVALEVLAANGVETFIQRDDGFAPTPVISRAILAHNKIAPRTLGMGLSSRHPTIPRPMAVSKYNPPNGGPADTDVTDWIQGHANGPSKLETKAFAAFNSKPPLKPPPPMRRTSLRLTWMILPTSSTSKRFVLRMLKLALIPLAVLPFRTGNRSPSVRS